MNIPPINQMPSSFAAEESIFTVSLGVCEMSNGSPGVYPMVSANLGSCVAP